MRGPLQSLGTVQRESFDTLFFDRFEITTINADVSAIMIDRNSQNSRNDKALGPFVKSFVSVLRIV